LNLPSAGFSDNAGQALYPINAEQMYRVYKTEAKRTCPTVCFMPKSLQAQRYRLLPAMLRKLREEAGLTQRELAKRLRLTHSLVHNCEAAERRVDVMEFAEWCVACDRDPIEVLRELLRRHG
jgi:DNA-binding transcriptional regulator YiaG